MAVLIEKYYSPVQDSSHNSPINKLSLVGMQLPGKYKENFDVTSEGPSYGVTGRYMELLVASNSIRRGFARNVEILLIFSRKLHPYQRKLVNIIVTTYTGTDSSIIVQDYRHHRLWA